MDNTTKATFDYLKSIRVIDKSRAICFKLLMAETDNPKSEIVSIGAAPEFGSCNRRQHFFVHMLPEGEIKQEATQKHHISKVTNQEGQEILLLDGFTQRNVVSVEQGLLKFLKYLDHRKSNFGNPVTIQLVAHGNFEMEALLFNLQRFQLADKVDKEILERIVLVNSKQVFEEGLKMEKCSLPELLEHYKQPPLTHQLEGLNVAISKRNLLNVLAREHEMKVEDLLESFNFQFKSVSEALEEAQEDQQNPGEEIVVMA